MNEPTRFGVTDAVMLQQTLVTQAVATIKQQLGITKTDVLTPEAVAVIGAAMTQAFVTVLIPLGTDLPFVLQAVESSWNRIHKGYSDMKKESAN